MDVCGAPSFPRGLARDNPLLMKLIMNQADLKTVQRLVDDALKVYDRNRGALNSADISLMSMLNVLRRTLYEEISEVAVTPPDRD
jgi:hypothetical protein